MSLMHRMLAPTTSLIAGLLLAIPAPGQAEENSEMADMEVTMTVLTSDDALPERITREIVLPTRAAAGNEAPALGQGAENDAQSRGREFGQDVAEQARSRGRAFGQEIAEQARALREEAGSEFGQEVAEEARQLRRRGGGGPRRKHVPR